MALLAVHGFAPAVGALDITGLTVAATGANTANDLVDSGNDRAQLASSTSVVIAPSGPVPDTSGSSIAFQTRFASLLAVDGDGITLGTVNRAMTSAYEITFTVD